MITDNDLKKILSVLTGIVATKKDLQQFATKKDLQQFATKKDLQQFATKEDLKQFATKKDLDIEISGFATRADSRKQTEEINEKLTTFRSDILSHVDANMKEILAVREEQTMHTHSHMRQDENYADHEKRIRKLEKSPATL